MAKKGAKRTSKRNQRSEQNTINKLLDKNTNTWFRNLQQGFIVSIQQ